MVAAEAARRAAGQEPMDWGLGGGRDEEDEEGEGEGGDDAEIHWL